MYDEWYSFDLAGRKATTNAPASGHKRKESLLQQPNGNLQASSGPELLENVYETIPDTSGPPEAEVLRRSKSSSDLHGWRGVASIKDPRWKRKPRRNRRWDALLVDSHAPIDLHDELEASGDVHSDALLEASQQEYLLYHDQLRLTERHLEGLIEDTDETLKLLTELSDAFEAVETQTSSFRARCEHLLTEQTRLQTLADEVGNDLHYYAYLDNVTRRLNAPGAARLVDDPDFTDVLRHLDSCIAFMTKHPTYRDAESYLARYESLLTKALHLLEVGFTARLEKVSAEIGRQMAATQSESARHVLAYARFEEMLLDSRFLCQNVQKVTGAVYDQAGGPVAGGSVARDIYANTVNNLFQTYLAARERDIKLIMQRETDEFKNDAKSSSLETASRNFVKQGFERAFNESNLFAKIFDIEPQWSTEDRSVFVVLKSLNQRSPVNPATLAPLAAHLQAALAAAELATVCAVVGWLAHEYLLPADYEDDDGGGEPMPPFARKCRELSARLLTEHLWPFTDAAFEAELTRTISKAAVPNDALKIGPVVGGVSSSNAYPPVKTALKLLGMFDGCMPKERSQKNSQVVFKIVRETIQVLQRAEAKIRSSRLATDPDLFMVKNLLIIKNELVSLEIGDIRSQGGGDAGGVAMQHFAQIWDALSPQSWAGFLSSTIGGLLWSSSSPAARPGTGNGTGAGTGAATAAVTARTLTVEDMSSQLDELLRQSIYGFTRRWGGLLVDARGDRTGGRNVARVEAQLDEALAEAFSNQPEVVGKLKEAIAISAKAQREAAEEKKGVRRY